MALEWLRSEWLWSLLSRFWSLFQAFTGPPRPVITDGTGVVSTREIKDLKAKKFIMKTEGVRGPGGGSSEKAVAQAPQAHYTATDGGVICADKISNLDIDGDIDLSVTIKQSQTK